MEATRAPLLETKLHVPRQRRGVVARARLHEGLGGPDLPALVLISAPAGFGKTTLLTGWLGAAADVPFRTAWVSLDRRDSDPSLYWSYVIAALRNLAPEAGTQAIELLRSTPTELEGVISSLVNDLARLDDDLVLVLDDYHVVESLEVHESMRFLLDHLPAQLHLVVASRADPPWPLAGRRARGDLLEVRADDLRFTADEAQAYLNGVAGLELTATDIEALEVRTEGWIAALQLAALSLHGRDDPSAFIASFAGDDRFVVDYLVDEVLDQQPGDIRSFLVETSILSRLTAPLCAAVTGRSDARSMLEALERSNLFLTPLDDRRQWYRYHHLFGDVLRARLIDERPDGAAELHRRASAWFEGEGHTADAIRHAMAAGDVLKAAELVELALPALRQVRQDATQRAWLDALPDEVFANRPVLNLGRVGARMVTGETTDVEAFLDQIEAWLDGDRPSAEMIVHDHHEFRRLPAQAAMYRAGLALLRGDLAATVAHAERAATNCTEDDHIGRGAAAALIGLARWADGDLGSATRQYAAAIREFGRGGFFADILGCSLGLADMLVGQGLLSEAERTLDEALGLAAAHHPLRGTPDIHIGLAELHLERNGLDLAAEHLERSRDLGEWLALRQHAYRWRVVEARLRSIDGDHDGALALLQDAEQRYDTDYSPKVRPVAATTARLRLVAGDLTGAQRWAAGAGISTDDEPTYLREYEHLTFARVLLAGGRASDGVPLLERLLAAAVAGGRLGSAVEAGTLLALAKHARGDEEAARTCLDDALTRAAPERIVRVFLDLGTPMTALLESAARHGRATDHATALLAAAGRPRQTRQERGLVDELTSRELDVLRLLRTELTGPEIADELFVSLNTVRTHTKHIFAKLDVSNRRAAVRRADELGL